jgi:5'-nucleotidase
MLVANIDDVATGRRIAWPNMPASTMVEVAGVKVGVVGLATESTPFTTMPANFVGLAMAAPALAAITEATALRAAGAQVVVITAHLGSKCADLDHPDAVASCDQTAELFPLLHALPHGLVDVFVAGHTHAGVAHLIDDVAVIESFSSGRAFGRVDVRIGPGGGVEARTISRPQPLCPIDAEGNPAPVATCQPGSYEGRPVVADPAIAAIADAALARAGARRAEHLGVTVAATITRAHGTESALGNLMTDLMLAARPDAQVAMTNGGGLRADLPAGELTYGQLFEANPFDNRFAIVHLRGKDLRRLVTANLEHDGGITSWSGLTARARCTRGALVVELKVGGKPLVEDAPYTLATSDFLASGGDGVLARLALPAGAIVVTDVIIREAEAEVLRRRKGHLAPAALYDPTHPRLDYVGARPVACGRPGKSAAEEPSR